jgi:hypothetical protein
MTDTNAAKMNRVWRMILRQIFLNSSCEILFQVLTFPVFILYMFAVVTYRNCKLSTSSLVIPYSPVLNENVRPAFLVSYWELSVYFP